MNKSMVFGAICLILGLVLLPISVGNLKNSSGIGGVSSLAEAKLPMDEVVKTVSEEQTIISVAIPLAFFLILLFLVGPLKNKHALVNAINHLLQLATSSTEFLIVIIPTITLALILEVYRSSFLQPISGPVSMPEPGILQFVVALLIVIGTGKLWQARKEIYDTTKSFLHF